MAAKSMKRLSKNENKILKLEKLELKDVVCSICQSILIEPVTLPCYHYFCQRCFKGSVENNALCCPLCRLRIGSWLRTATKQNNLVNNNLWEYIKVKFSKEIDTKLKGGDVVLPEEKPTPRLSAPGEIRSEYEAELKRLRIERLQIEQKHLHETEILIKKIQQEEKEAQNRYIERLKQDALLAQKLQQENSKYSNVSKSQTGRAPAKNPRPKANTIDSYLAKTKLPPAKESPLITDDNTTSTEGSTPNTVKLKPNSKASPEMVPTYGKLIKSFLDKRIKAGANFWNKENGDKRKTEDAKSIDQDKGDSCDAEKPKNGIKSLLVSLPLPSSGIPQRTVKLTENRSLQTGSVDSMHQELCYFKPIEQTAPISQSSVKAGPVRVPGVRARGPPAPPPPPPPPPAPSRAMYIEGLCRLRRLSLTTNLPSAFVIALNILTKENPTKCSTNNRSKIKSTAPPTQPAAAPPPKRRAPNKNDPSKQLNNVKLNSERTLRRRTKSMGSIKEENETTPKKAKIQERKATSDRKPHLRSDSKKLDAKKRLNISEDIEAHFAEKACKCDLSSPMNCDLRNILQEQLKIEKLIKQEQRDLELARKMDAEWNGRRQPRRCAAKRQVTMNYALRPAKKLKI